MRRKPLFLREECRTNFSQEFFCPFWESRPERIIPEVWDESFFYLGWLNLDGGKGSWGGSELPGREAGSS